MIDINKMLSDLLPLTIFVIAFVAFLKMNGVQGVWLTRASFAFGLVLGVLYHLAFTITVGWAGWFIAVLYGLLLGFIACGAYNAGQFIAVTNKSDMP